MQVGKVVAIEDFPGEEPQTFLVETFIPHPNMSSMIPKVYYNDIALVKLTNDIDFSAFVRPACLNTNVVNEGTEAVISGWTFTSNTERFLFDVVIEVKKDLLSANVCSWTYFSIFPLGKVLCATSRIGVNKKLCTVSGSPMQVSHKEHCMHNIIGVVSCGMDCLSKRLPDVVTRVANHIDWIEATAFDEGEF